MTFSVALDRYAVVDAFLAATAIGFAYWGSILVDNAQIVLLGMGIALVALRIIWVIFGMAWDIKKKGWPWERSKDG